MVDDLESHLEESGKCQSLMSNAPVNIARQKKRMTGPKDFDGL